MRDLIANAFTAEGHRIDVDILPPERLDQAIAEAAQSDIDVLVVGGGDGTIRTAVTHLMGTGKALGILPLGTMNRLAKDLEIPLDLASAAAYLATATPSWIDVAKVNGSVFMCNSLMGLTLRYSVARARMRGKPATQRLPKYFATVRDILSSKDKISITVDHGEERMRLRVLSVAVTNNGYDENLTLVAPSAARWRPAHDVRIEAPQRVGPCDGGRACASRPVARRSRHGEVHGSELRYSLFQPAQASRQRRRDQQVRYTAPL